MIDCVFETNCWYGVNVVCPYRKKNSVLDGMRCDGGDFLGRSEYRGVRECEGIGCRGGAHKSGQTNDVKTAMTALR